MEYKKIKYLLLFIILILFLFGIIKLFSLSFDRGNFFPDYSSLRQGPSGTKILVESLKELPNIDLKRNFRPLSKISRGSNTTIFYLGGEKKGLYYNEDLLKEFNRLLLDGGRIVISFFPVKTKLYPLESHKNSHEDSTLAEYESTEQSCGSCGKISADFPKEWGVDFDQMLIDSTFNTTVRLAVPVEEFNEISSKPISWYTSLFFDKLGGAWKVLYKADVYPVIIEREFGKGSIVLVADSYFFSNEAMYKERHAELLSYLVSSNRTIIFDETHFNIFESPGIISLVKKYHLEGILFGLLIISFLFIWKNSVSFIPYGNSGLSESEDLKGNYAAQGFINILRKYIPPDNLIQICISEWEKSFKYNKKYFNKMKSIKQPLLNERIGKDNLLEIYKKISDELKRKEK